VTNEYGAVKLASSVPGAAEVSGRATDGPPGVSGAEGMTNAALDIGAKIAMLSSTPRPSV